MSQPAETEHGRLLRLERSRADAMDVKSYYARSIDEAVGLATYEIGPDAMLLDSRRSPVETRHLGEYEVRFAVPAAATKPTPAGAASAPANPELAAEVARMRSELSEMRELFQKRPGRKRSGDTASLRVVAPSRVTRRLTDCGFSPELAAELAVAVESGPAGSSPGRAQEAALDAELRRRLNAAVSQKPREASSIVFIGPPGCGKTTAMIKLAVRHCANGQGPAILVNTDTFRIGAAEQMARYAAILGLPLLTADTATGLRQVMETRAARTLLLIDTPGLSGSDMEMFEQAGYFLAARTDVERHLIIPATMHSADMARVYTRYERFRPTRLAFTRVDETDRFGALITTACNLGLPVSWISAGQRIPDDLEFATPESLCRLVAPKKKQSYAERRRESAS